MTCILGEINILGYKLTVCIEVVEVIITFNICTPYSCILSLPGLAAIGRNYYHELLEQVGVRIRYIAALCTNCYIEAQQEAVLCIRSKVNLRRDEPVLSRAGRRACIVSGRISIDILITTNACAPIVRSSFTCFIQLCTIEYLLCSSSITTPPVLRQVSLHSVEVLIEANYIVRIERTHGAPFRLVTGYGIAEVFETEEVLRSRFQVLNLNTAQTIELLVINQVLKLFVCCYLQLYIRIECQFCPADCSRCSGYILCTLTCNRRTEVTLDNLQIIYEEVAGRRTCC